MLWSDKDLKLPNNYYSAFAQLKSLEKRLERDSELKKFYGKTIQDDLEKGYISYLLITMSSTRSPTASGFYPTIQWLTE